MYREAGDVQSQLLFADDNDKYTKFRKSRRPTGSIIMYLVVLSIVIFIFFIRMFITQTHFYSDQDQLASSTGLSVDPPYNKFRKPLRHQPTEDVCITDMSFHAELLENEIKRSQYLYANDNYRYHSEENERRHSQLSKDDERVDQKHVEEETAYAPRQESHDQQIHSNREEVNHNSQSGSDHSLIDHAVHHEHAEEESLYTPQQQSHDQQIHSNREEINHNSQSGSDHSLIDHAVHNGHTEEESLYTPLQESYDQQIHSNREEINHNSKSGSDHSLIDHTVTQTHL